MPIFLQVASRVCRSAAPATILITQAVRDVVADGRAMPELDRQQLTR